jgi:serine phosphatase RsbU (regulator of sigma subunit)
MTVCNVKSINIISLPCIDKPTFSTFFFVMLLLMTGFCSCSRTVLEPRARNGVLDLRNWSFHLDGPAELAGEWEFFWKQDLKPGDFIHRPAPRPTGFIRIPGIWNEYRIGGEELGADGFATLRLRVITGSAGTQLAVKIHDAYSAYRLYVNGRELAAAGVFGTKPVNEEPRQKSQVIVLSSGGPDLDILINLSNFHYIYGGIDGPILIGDEKTISGIREKNLFYGIFLFGSILFIGLYHLFHYATRRTDKSSLYFGIFCVATSTYPLTFGETYLLDLFPGVPWSVLMKIVILLFYLSAPVFAMYWQSLYPEEFSKKVLRVIQAIGAALFIIAASTGPKVFFYSLKVYEAFILIASVYVIYVLIASAIRKREGSIIFLAGFLALALAILNDSLYDNRLIKTGILIPWGLFMFLISQSIILAMRYARSFASVERLSTELKGKSDDLQNMNLRLEQRVRERTQKIEKAQDEMKTLLQVYGAMNDNLFQVTRELEHAHRTMEQDMEMAASVQARYFTPVPPKARGWEVVFVMKPLSIISGDLYDFYMDGDRLLGVSLFDVSGHGAASGLITMIAKSISYRNFNASPYPGLDRVMKNINAELIQEIGKVGSYVTGVMLRFTQNKVDYANAGHPDILIKRKGSQKSEILAQGEQNFKGHFMGVPFFDKDDYGVYTCTVNRGDTLLIYSDALIETSDAGGEQYGIKRLMSSLDEVSPEATAGQQLNAVMGDFSDYVGNGELNDDLTVIFLKKA